MASELLRIQSYFEDAYQESMYVGRNPSLSDYICIREYGGQNNSNLSMTTRVQLLVKQTDINDTLSYEKALTKARDTLKKIKEVVCVINPFPVDIGYVDNGYLYTINFEIQREGL